VKNKISPIIFSGIPVVAIHGTHERRSKSFVNPIQLLEKMGYLIHLHGTYAIFEKNGGRVAIHGMSGVPERFAPEVFNKLNFKPIPNAYNILVLHQSIGGYVYSDDEESVLKLSDLPVGFDLIIDGHIHWYKETKQKNLVFPGSTVMTQMRKVESEVPKGFLKVDTETKKIEFIRLKSARKFFFKEFNINDLSSNQINEKIAHEIQNILRNSFDREPIVRFVLKGEKDFELDLKHLNRLYGDKIIIKVNKKLKIAKRNLQYLSEFKKNRKSITEIGKEILENNLSKTFKEKINFDFYDFFELLAKEKLDESFNLLMEDLEVKNDNEN